MIPPGGVIESAQNGVAHVEAQIEFGNQRLDLVSIHQTAIDTDYPIGIGSHAQSDESRVCVRQREMPLLGK